MGQATETIMGRKKKNTFGRTNDLLHSTHVIHVYVCVYRAFRKILHETARPGLATEKCCCVLAFRKMITLLEFSQEQLGGGTTVNQSFERTKRTDFCSVSVEGPCGRRNVFTPHMTFFLDARSAVTSPFPAQNVSVKCLTLGYPKQTTTAAGRMRRRRRYS